MRPVVVLAQQVVQSLQQQVVSLLATELELLSTFEFTPEELQAAGWNPELIERIEVAIEKMKAQVGTAGLCAAGVGE